MDSNTGMPPPGEWKGWPWDFSGFPHDDYGPQVNYGIWVLTFLAAGFLGLRVYCKFLRHRGLWWDDHVLILSWIMLCVQTSLVSFNTTIGYGMHIWDFHVKDITTFLLVSNTSGFFSILAAAWSKTSFAITVLRISDEGWMRKFVWFVIISINATLGFAAVITWIQCTPSEKLWKPAGPGTCWPKEFTIQYNIFVSAYSGAMDIILAFLPWRIISKLTMNKKEKLGVMLAMSMGVFAGAMSIVKITQIPAINKADLIDGIWLSILATAETAMTIMAASIPILRALVRDSPPRAPPVRFIYRPHDVYTGVGFAGGAGGRSSTTISSRPRSSAAATISGGSSYLGHIKNRNGGSKSSLRSFTTARRFSGLSMSWAYSWTNKYVSRREDDDDYWLRKMAETPEPPPGKIIQTDEVSVEWEEPDRSPRYARRSTPTAEDKDAGAIGYAL